MEQIFCLAPVFSDGVVLQRREPVWIFGGGEEGAAVEVRLSSMERPCRTVVRDGEWRVSLPPEEAAEGLTLTASSRGQTVIVQDVAVGEVWIAGGQSNMEFWLRNEAERDAVIPAADDGLLRFFDMPRISYEGQRKDLSFTEYGVWRKFTPEHAGWFSAVGAYFGMALRRTLGVPVAVVGCNCGATSASCWISEAYLEEIPALRVYRESYEQTLKTLDLTRYERDFKERQAWGQMPRMVEFDQKMARGELQAETLQDLIGQLGKQLTKRQWELLSLPCGPMAPTRPCALYHSMVERLAPYTARGVIWYQGESDADRAEHYAALFGQVVRCWRSLWERELPFLTVQLAPFGRWLNETGEMFPALREQQELACRQMPDVWMASIMDAGMEKDIHPKNKRIPGERLALLARGKVYGEDTLCEPPAFEKAVWEGDTVQLTFANAGEGLRVKGEFPRELEMLLDGERGAGTISVEKERLIIWCDRLKDACKVDIRYAWQPYICAGLYNSAGLCAKPFRVSMKRAQQRS